MMFNPNYVNMDYYNQPQIQQQIAQHNHQQTQEVANAVKAMKDLCDAISKIDEAHQPMAFSACLAVMVDKGVFNNK